MHAPSPMAEAGLPGFKRVQYQFCAHIRDPEHNPPPPGLRDDRLDVYREYVFGNIKSFMAHNFPVLRKVLPDDRWQPLMRDYFSRHKCQTPLFSELPQEFLRFLETERDPAGDPPFLYELAHYEWMESAVGVDPRDIDMAGIDPDGDLVEGVPVLSPLACPLAYHWPVHRIGPDFQPQEPPAAPTYLVVYRDRRDAIGFMEMNPVTARLIERIVQEPDLTGAAHLEAIAAELNHPRPEVVVAGGRDIMAQLRARDILLGTRVGRAAA